MRELDAVLAAFFETQFASLQTAERAAFAAILDLPDPEIHGLLLGRRLAEDPDVATVIAAIQRSARAASQAL